MTTEEQTALVIGAGGAIGAAMASALEATMRVTRISSRPGTGLVTDYSEESLARLASETGFRFDLILVCTGFLHGEGQQPEKSLRQLDADGLALTFHKNFIVPALILKHFAPLLKRRQRSTLVLLSARVGSIGDNRAGGWYGYRASKAALNMLVKNTAIELGRVNREVVVVALHPGTTASDLSSPFTSSRGAPEAVPASLTAERLLKVITNLDANDNGGFLDWAGKAVPW